jgi:hypothetical protein
MGCPPPIFQSGDRCECFIAVLRHFYLIHESR